MGEYKEYRVTSGVRFHLGSGIEFTGSKRTYRTYDPVIQQMIEGTTYFRQGIIVLDSQGGENAVVAPKVVAPPKDVPKGASKGASPEDVPKDASLKDTPPKGGLLTATPPEATPEREQAIVAPAYDPESVKTVQQAREILVKYYGYEAKKLINPASVNNAIEAQNLVFVNMQQ